MGQMLKNDSMGLAEEQAFQLSRFALAIDHARQKLEDDPAQLVSALNENLHVWIAIRTMATREDSGLTNEIKKNLTTLSNYVADRTFSCTATWSGRLRP